MSAAFALLLLAQGGEPDPLRALEARVRAAAARATPAYVFFSQGSGVCISPDGWVLTNYHVSGERDGQRVRMTGGRTFTADVVGWDPHGDVSLCRLREAEDLPWCDLGDSDLLRPGQRVIAVGNPFLLGTGSWEPSVALGIVSALHRYMDNPGFFDAIQTDAQINPGNSGGPLLTLDGKIAGINGRIDIRRFQNRVNTGIGYAIPANQIRRYLEALKKGGRVREGFIQGITIGECGDPRHPEFGVYGDGVFVAGVTEGTPAAEAGFEPGDVIFEIEGRRVFNANRFHGAVANGPEGGTVAARVRRGGAERELRVFLGDPEAILQRTLAASTEDLGFRLSGREVGSIDEGGAASRAGLRVGDVILGIEGNPVPDEAAVLHALRRRKPGDVFRLIILRQGSAITLTLKVL